MDEDDETYLHVTYASHVDMNEAFRVRMLAAITAGLEKAPIGVVTTPGTKNHRYLANIMCGFKAAEPRAHLAW
jgi:hypothetical protein